MTYSVRSRRVVLRDGAKLVIAPALVHIEGAHIAAVERLGSDVYDREAADAATVELGDHLLTPAFVNAHTHLALAFLRGVDAQKAQNNLVEDLYFKYESKLSAEDVRAFTRMGAYESLLSGVGFVWDHYYAGDAVAAALQDTGLAGVVAPTLQDLAGPGKDHSERALETTLTLARDERLRSHGIYAALGPHATDTVSPALFRRIAALAHDHTLPVHLHLAQSFDELLRVETREGRSPLSLLAREEVLTKAPHVVLAHGLYVPKQDLLTLDPMRHTLVYCPSSQVEFGFPAPVPVWSELGLSWVVATDCASSNDSMSLQKELRIARGAASAMTTGSIDYERFLARARERDAEDTWRLRSQRVEAFRAHVSAERLLERVWDVPGGLHPQVRVGRIEAGALANLVAWNTDHPSFWPEHDLLRSLAMADTTQAIHALFVAGKRIGRVGQVVESVITSDDYREAKLEATERLTHLLT